MKREYGEDRFEFWNAGVEAYNTEQELLLLERYNLAIDPDHVILTLHNNDFVATPVVIDDGAGRRTRHFGRPSVLSVNGWLYRRSLLYRVWVNPLPQANDHPTAECDVEVAVGRFQELLERRGIRFTVLVLPIIEPYPDHWRPEELRRRRESLRILRNLNIRHFDLLEPLQQAMAEGIPCSQRPNDRWHPSRQLGRVFARFLHQRDLLAP